MKIPNLVTQGLSQSYESGYNSAATGMLYNYTKKSPDQISNMIRETWIYIKNENKENNVLCHFLYLLKHEVNIEWIKDIAFEIVEYSLSYDDIEVLDETIGLIDTWADKKMLDLLYNTKIKERWLNDYKIEILKEHNYKV